MYPFPFRYPLHPICLRSRHSKTRLSTLTTESYQSQESHKSQFRQPHFVTHPQVIIPPSIAYPDTCPFSTLATLPYHSLVPLDVPEVWKWLQSSPEPQTGRHERKWEINQKSGSSASAKAQCPRMSANVRRLKKSVWPFDISLCAHENRANVPSVANHIRKPTGAARVRIIRHSPRPTLL